MIHIIKELTIIQGIVALIVEVITWILRRRQIQHHSVRYSDLKSRANDLESGYLENVHFRIDTSLG